MNDAALRVGSEPWLRIFYGKRYTPELVEPLIGDQALDGWIGSYQSYIASTHWTRTRDAFLSRQDVHVCASCGRKQRKNQKGRGTFNVHHRTYVRLGRESEWDLVLLCRPCHISVHDRIEQEGGDDWDLWFAHYSFAK